MLHEPCIVTLGARLRRWLRYLAVPLSGVINQQWARRKQSENTREISNVFGNSCIGSVDTFPIKIYRPKDRVLQKATYSGKYKYHCFKIQAIADNGGRPVYLSGPHVEVRADIDIWRLNGPELDANEYVLGDKAYVGAQGVSVPYKKPPGGDITAGQKDFNTIHSWCRVTVEHVFGQMKKFNILGTTYRGRVSFLCYAVLLVCYVVCMLLLVLFVLIANCNFRSHQIWSKRSVEMLEDAVLVIAGLTVLQFQEKPLRSDVLLPEIDDEDNRVPLGDAVDFADYKRMWRLPASHSHLKLGDPDCDITLEDGKVTGPGDPPTANEENSVNTGCSVADFQVGDQVLGWWWRRWWPTKVQYLSKRNQTLTLRWEWDCSVTSGFRPGLVMIFPK